MLTIERVSVMNLENAIRGARNPMNSWNRKASSTPGEGQAGMFPKTRRLRRKGADNISGPKQKTISGICRSWDCPETKSKNT